MKIYKGGTPCDSHFCIFGQSFNVIQSLLQGVVKKSSLSLNLKIPFKWNAARLHSDGFGVFMFLYTLFLACRAHFAKFNVNLWKI